ncbi:MAG: prolipoprotein diacylglyceryl transferase [Bacteroidaceae bacterium]|nr:prolipoprotein diacylglyceryl transferase [Bacteroidaceae bacterium]
MLGSIVWDVDPTIFEIGGRQIRWYGLMWGLGFILAYKYAEWIFKKEKYPEEWVDKLFVYSLISVVVGARLGHCLFYQWDYYTSNPVEILKIWEGGLASHGGVFGVIFAAWLYSKKITKQSVWWLFDRIIPSVAVLCFCIRFGNLMNSEIFGFPTTMPWGFEFVRSREWHQLYEGQACHPTQIYEMLYCLTAGVVSYVMYHKFHLQKYVGLITGVSLLIFFGTRLALEFMKNPQVASEVGMTLNIGQLLSLPLIALGLYLIWKSRTARELPVKYK